MKISKLRSQKRITFLILSASLMLISTFALAFIDFSQHKLVNLSGTGEPEPDLNFTVTLTKYERNLFGETTEEPFPNAKFKLYQSNCPADTKPDLVEENCRENDVQVLGDLKTNESGQIQIYNLPYPVEGPSGNFHAGESEWYYFHEEQAPEGYVIWTAHKHKMKWNFQMVQLAMKQLQVLAVTTTYKTTGSKFPQILELEEVIYWFTPTTVKYQLMRKTQISITEQVETACKTTEPQNSPEPKNP